MTATHEALKGRIFKHAGNSYLVTDMQPHSTDVLSARRVDRTKAVEEFAVGEVLKCLGSTITLD